VLPNRDSLDVIANRQLSGRTVDVQWKSESRQYQLVELVGSGQTGVAWRVLDGFARPFALKFVLRSDYGTHSLDAEAQRANSLQSRLFAKIDYFGEPHFADNVPACEPFYAIAVDWIDGQSLSDALADSRMSISPEAFLRLSRDFCEVLQALKDKALCHSDLHDKNVVIRPQQDVLLDSVSYQIAVIDTGQLKTEQRRLELLESWQQQLSTLERVASDDSPQIIESESRLRRWIAYFIRTDQEWVVCHLCSLYNLMRARLPFCNAAEKRFIRDLPNSLRSMIDPDPSRRIDDPRQMFDEINRAWSAASQTEQLGMLTPFDLPSAELIRSDRQLMALFSDEYPRLESCRSLSPVYLYGPRGSGKSTILRSLSLRAILEAEKPSDEFRKSPFVGVYLSASQELRSRFWLMEEDDFRKLEGHVVRYFNLLLVESLVDTLDAAYTFGIQNNNLISFGLTETVAAKCVSAIRQRLGLDASNSRYAGVSVISVLRDDVRRVRDLLWGEILDRQTSPQRPDAQLVFDVCRSIEDHWSFIKEHRLVFLIDDYSNQRIPVGLQKRLNQSITFSKQGSPIFKVTSEYDGVDLEGVQEGREVFEVNIGYEYVSLRNSKRYAFLKNVLERRFAYMKQPANLVDVLSLSNIEPAIAMAREIRAAVQAKTKFHYYGLDTIGDLCSGDFAMGIDLVRRIFEAGHVDWRAPRRISAATQDRVIRDFAKHEFEYIRYNSPDGRIKFEIADRLCWLSKECVLTKDTVKDGNTVPVVKNHIDIAETALRQLEDQYPEKAVILQELVARGILFPLQPSRTRQGRDATYRLMIRRILLSSYTTALGRDQSIRIDDVQRLIHLLTEPTEFARQELGRTAVAATAAKGAPSVIQGDLFDPKRPSDG
jgi:serine/threonine protein kinase